MEITKREKNRILQLHESRKGIASTSQQLIKEEDLADKMMECQEKNVGNFTPEDEKQFGILFNSIEMMGTNEKAVYGVISHDNYNYFDNSVRMKFSERLKCITGDKFYGIVDFIMKDFSGKEKEKVTNMLNVLRVRKIRK